MTWTLIGSAMEIVGLGVAAYGLFLTWRGVAEGHLFIPRRQNRPFHGSATIDLPAISGRAYGYVTDPNESVDEKLARVHAVLATFDQRLAAETRDREAAVAQLRSEILADLNREDSERKAEARSDTRLAVAGLAFAAAGSVLQLLG